MLIKQYILEGVDVLPSLNGITVSGGRLNLYNSVQLMLNSSSVDERISDVPFMLSNYPNPFNPAVAGAGRSPGTTISFNLTAEDASLRNNATAWQAEDAKIEIYNLKGQKVKQFSDIRNQTSVVWDGTDQTNKPVPSGIYFYKLNIENSPVKKMLLLK